MRRRWMEVLGLVLFQGACAFPDAAPSRSQLFFSPYQHLGQGVGLSTERIEVPAFGALTWAFATGQCGQEHWGGLEADHLARVNVERFERAGRGYVISTGGEGGAFQCGSEVAMEAFIRRYDSSMLRGVDFDIESSQTPEQIQSLVLSVAAVAPRHPRLRFSFTLATHAATDGSRHSLNRLGETVLAAIRAAGLERFTLNLMVMNYGPGESAYCVPAAGGGCDMARSAAQAVDNVHHRYGVPYGQIEVTAMLGENDVADNVFRLADVAGVVALARDRGLAGVHYWSRDRDAPCAAGSPRVSPTCHGLDEAPGAFERAFLAALR